MIAGAVGISSSAIVTKILVEMHRLTNRETRLILGIVVVEDLFLAVYLAALQPVLDESAGAVDAVLSFSKAFAFLVVVALVARYGSQYVERLIGAEQDELLTVCFVGLAVLVAGIAEELHVSDAIGAFMAGLVVAETAVAPRVRTLVLPLRDTFAALFFFTFGLTVDPGDVASVAGPIAAAIALTAIVNFTAALIVGRRERLSRTQTTNLATTILARGEFSLIIATLGAEAGLDGRWCPSSRVTCSCWRWPRRSSPRSRRGWPAGCRDDWCANRVRSTTGRWAAAGGGGRGAAPGTATTASR